VVDLQGDRIAAEQPLVQQLHPGALDKAQLQQATLQLGGVLVFAVMAADANDDAGRALAGLAEFEGVGHDARMGWRGLRLPDSDYQVRRPSVHPGKASQWRLAALFGYHGRTRSEPVMKRLV